MTVSTVLYLVFFLLYAFVIRDWVAVAEISTANQLRGMLLEIPHLSRHPIYLSLFIGVSVLYVFHALIFQKSTTGLQKSLLIAALITLILFLFLIQSKGALIFLILSIPAMWILQGRKYMVRFLFLTLLITVSGVIVISIMSSQNRFKELWDPETYSDSGFNPYNSSQIRIAIWKTSVAAIQRSPIWGYGLGDVQNELDEGYRKSFPFLLEKQYNSHNQYMGIWLSAGIAGLFLLLLLFYTNMRKLLRGHSEPDNLTALSLAILVFFALNFLTENVIERQLGSLLFFFFLNLLGSTVSCGKTLVYTKDRLISRQIRTNNYQM
jgi:O-antigen ligase